MIFFDDAQSKDKYIKKISNQIDSNLEILNKHKSIILKYITKVADFPTVNVDLSTVNSLIEFLTNLKDNLTLIDENISILKKFQTKFNSILDFNENSDKCIDDELNNCFNEYFEISQNVTTIIIKVDIFFIEASDVLKLSFSFDNYKIFQEKQEIHGCYSSQYKNDFQNIPHLENNDCIKNITKNNSDQANIKKDDLTENSFIQDNLLDNDFYKNNLVNNDLVENTSEQNILKNDNLIENTLVISENKNNVILPYKINDLNAILELNKDKYNNIYEIIEQHYTIPYSNYKSPVFSRFKEAFKLIRNKEQGSIKDAIDLGFELMFNYSLHPAIISACKNLDELDIYLDYLDTNETDKFDCFNIKFEIAPIQKT